MSTKIKLPALLEGNLCDATHEPAVRKALQEFGRWFGESKQTFFPDYTNHGIQHIEQVLETVANLIPEESRGAFSKDDAAALILTVLLHDSALHLSKDGFYRLVKGTQAYVPVPFFDRSDWGQTWADFMFLARRWDDTMLANVFGADASGAPRAQVRDPFDHWQNLTETDNLLIGEFIRKHHPRLAHEMALYGVPGTTGTYLDLADLPSQWRDLVGLIARSHGLPLRTGLEYLKKTPHFGTFAHRDYKTVHAVYLMTLLRVGDYIQIQGDRTSELVFQYKNIPSLVSRVEHKVHLADITITDATDDPESLQIDAHPQEVAVFLRLKEWLAGIQQELDSSWAVLGEVYGLQTKTKLNTLGLTFRRVRSNLDDVAEFAKTVPYVPDRIRFDVARAELLKLLIGPLYGDDPSYGVRELMQNSIDAVREYDQFVLDNPQYKDVPRREQEADVVVELGPFDEEKGYAVMTISDRGIGMTEATIRDYFLRAGASYRRSAEWKVAFEKIDVEGDSSKVLRSGRFGIGALAVFLIGKEVEVSTRNIAANEGYRFVTNLDAESISIERCNLLVGTTLRILVDKNNYNSLISVHQKKTMPSRFDWYQFDKPTVLRRWYNQDGSCGYKKNINKINFGDDAQQWRKLNVPYEYEVYWNLSNAPVLTCNGLFVSNGSSLRNISQEILGSKDAPVQYPLVAVLDASANFPLNLERNNIRTDGYAFGLILVKDVLQEMLAWLLFNGPEAMESPKIKASYLPWLTGSESYSSIVASNKGFAIKLTVVLDGTSIRHAINYHRTGLNLKEVPNDSLLFGAYKVFDYNPYGSSLMNLTVVNKLDNELDVLPFSREIIYDENFKNKLYSKKMLSQSLIT
jgi:hypothetical protein